MYSHTFPEVAYFHVGDRSSGADTLEELYTLRPSNASTAVVVGVEKMLLYLTGRIDRTLDKMLSGISSESLRSDFESCRCQLRFLFVKLICISGDLSECES